MILEVKFWPNQCLKEKAKMVTEKDLPAAEKLVDDLFETMYAWRGLGLAATQVAVPIQVLVIDTEQAGGGLKRAFINRY